MSLLAQRSPADIFLKKHSSRGAEQRCHAGQTSGAACQYTPDLYVIPPLRFPSLPLLPEADFARINLWVDKEALEVFENGLRPYLDSIVLGRSRRVQGERGYKCRDLYQTQQQRGGKRQGRRRTAPVSTAPRFEQRVTWCSQVSSCAFRTEYFLQLAELHPTTLPYTQCLRQRGAVHSRSFVRRCMKRVTCIGAYRTGVSDGSYIALLLVYVSRVYAHLGMRVHLRA